MSCGKITQFPPHLPCNDSTKAAESVELSSSSSTTSDHRQTSAPIKFFLPKVSRTFLGHHHHQEGLPDCLCLCWFRLRESIEAENKRANLATVANGQANNTNRSGLLRGVTSSVSLTDAGESESKPRGLNQQNKFLGAFVAPEEER